MTGTIEQRKEALKTYVSIGVKVIAWGIALGSVLMLFVGPTYHNAITGDYGEAVIGGLVVLAISLTVAWWLSKKFDVRTGLRSKIGIGE